MQGWSLSKGLESKQTSRRGVRCHERSERQTTQQPSKAMKNKRNDHISTGEVERQARKGTKKGGRGKHVHLVSKKWRQRCVREKVKSDTKQANHSKSAFPHVPFNVLVNQLWLIVALVQQRERMRRRECHGGSVMIDGPFGRAIASARKFGYSRGVPDYVFLDRFTSLYSHQVLKYAPPGGAYLRG